MALIDPDHAGLAVFPPSPNSFGQSSLSLAAAGGWPSAPKSNRTRPQPLCNVPTSSAAFPQLPRGCPARLCS